MHAALAFLAVSLAPPAAPEPPAVRDDRLRLELVAREPDVVTPVGVAVDGKGRVFVIESHTHSPAKDYPGPKTDLIKRLDDTDGDGKPDRVSVFADGFKDAMNLAFSPSGELYVCHRTGVVVLHDRDGDGKNEAREEILKLETGQTYSHNCLLGIAFSADGWLYVSRGNLGGYPYSYVGSDGARLSGYGDGGDVVKCKPDGGGLRRVATGFWNPFGLDFDANGRLLCVDNDPDARGPNRLLHILEGGDYGFKTRFGAGGLHPYQAWDGELPGTLPMLAGVGEAPSGVLDADRAALPGDYKGNILVTVWGTHRVARFRPKPAGVSLKAKEEALLEGGRAFRPVGIAAAPDGSVYVTDWVKKDYPNHGHGRVWRLSAKRGVETTKPRDPWAKPRSDAGAERLDRLLAAETADRFDELIRSACDADEFVRSAALTALARPVFRDKLLADLGHAEAGRRVFFHPTPQCANCHTVDGRGGPVGPDLSKVGRAVDRRQLLRHVLKPSEEIAQEYQGYTVNTADGKAYVGTQFHFRGSDLTLILLDGKEVRLRLKDVESYEVSQKSLMPDGLEKLMSVRDFRNLLAYLEALK